MTLGRRLTPFETSLACLSLCDVIQRVVRLEVKNAIWAKLSNFGPEYVRDQI
jgi:hypothetical protein